MTIVFVFEPLGLFVHYNSSGPLKGSILSSSRIIFYPSVKVHSDRIFRLQSHEMTFTHGITQLMQRNNLIIVSASVSRDNNVDLC